MRLNTEEAADYLHMPAADLQELVKHREIPFETVAGQIIFTKEELAEWISRHLLSMKKDHLTTFHHKATEFRSVIDTHQVFLSGLISEACIVPDLPAKTKPSVLRELAAAAMATGYLSDERELLDLLRDREEQGTTGLEKGIAMPHPAAHPPYLLWDSIVIIGRVEGGIPYGAMDGSDTDLFFMPCAHDDSHHVYMLARLALMLHDTDLAVNLRQAEDAREMLIHFRNAELELVEKMGKAFKLSG